MTNFLYISDVFCPWCYGFEPIMRRLAAERPQLPVRVLCGALMEDPVDVADMREEMPNIREFFVRLRETTGQAVGEGFLQHLDAAHGELSMHSPGVSLPLRVLKELAPGRALEQMEAFQHAFYGEGKDVLGLPVQHELARSFGVNAQDFDRALRDQAIAESARAEAEEAAEIMGEFTLYPTLYLENGAERTLLARGFVPYETVAAKLAKALPSLAAS